MLDAIAQTLAEQAAKPAAPVHTNPPKAALVALQPTIVPVPTTVSAPETLLPSFLPQPKRNASTAPAAKPAASSHTVIAKEPPVSYPTQGEQARFTRGQAVNVAVTSSPTEQATAEQRLVLKQRLADLVAKEKPLKEAKLRANLEAIAIAMAQAGQFLQARRMVQDQMLSPDDQAALLAQIDAIAAGRTPTKPVLALKRSLPSLPAKLKPWIAAPVGRSLPSVLPYTPPSDNTPYSYILPPSPQYVSYSFNEAGRSIGGFGVVIDDNTSGLSGQSWATYVIANRFNAELWSGLSFMFPLASPAPITSGFGWRVHPIRGDRRFHSGIDLGAPMGTPVLAAASGKVALADWLSGYGLAVILSHQNDTRETLYGHLSQVFVKPGQWVEKGTVIGRVGSTGLSTGPHLHFELRQKVASGWQAIDPGVQLKYALARLIKAMQSG